MNNEMSETTYVADRIRRLRNERRWSARELADRCAAFGMSSLTRSTIAKIESGVRKSVTVDELSTLARALGVPVESLVAPHDATTLSETTPTAAVTTSTTATPDRLANPADVPSRAGLDDLPVRPGVFVGRAAELDLLDTLAKVHTGVVVHAIHGLGGIGKSTLAAYWAATRAHRFAPIRWINADSPTNIQAGLAALATALEPTLIDALPLEALAERAVQWLASHNGWLLVLDNVGDPADIAFLLARAPSGHFLITSRLAAVWHGVAGVLRLDVLDHDEALELLNRAIIASGRRQFDGAEELCADLGYLPLAVAQAAAYLAQNPLITPNDYRALLAEYPKAMLRQGAVGVPADHTVAKVWRVTLDRLADFAPAVDVLRILSWYASDSIPIGLLDGLFDSPTLIEATGLLVAYSMIAADPAAGTVSVHRLLQTVARTSDPDDPHRAPSDIEAAHTLAISQLDQLLPLQWEDPAGWPTWRTLFPHLDALADRSPADHDGAVFVNLLSRAGAFLADQGLLTRAIVYLERARRGAERLLGLDDPQTMTITRHLADTYRAAGDPSLALALLEDSLNTAERVLGPDHPQTLATRNSLANVFETTWDREQAVPLLERTLAHAERALGQHHLQTLVARHNLAAAYTAAGDPERSIPLLESTLVDAEEVLGENHSRTLMTRNSLATAHRAAGNLDKSIDLFERVATDAERALGSEHPDTLIARRSLAGAYSAADKQALAIPLLERTLADAERVLGAAHPDTLATRNELATAYRQVGQHERSIPLFERVSADADRVLGPEHPDTLIARRRLAEAYAAAGEQTRAIPLLERVLADAESVLGTEHPDTLAINETLARMRLTTTTGTIPKSTAKRSDGKPTEPHELTNHSGLSATAISDSAAWRRITDRYSKLVWSVARSFKLSEEEAATVVQTTWLRLADDLHRFENNDSQRLESWLATTTRRESIRVLRQRDRETAPSDTAGELDAVPDSIRSPTASDDSYRELWDAFAALSPRCRELLRILAISPVDSYAQIAAKLNMPIGSIGPTRARCLDHLRRALVTASEIPNRTKF